jgi:hypothetical protein
LVSAVCPLGGGWGVPRVLWGVSPGVPLWVTRVPLGVPRRVSLWYPGGHDY